MTPACYSFRMYFIRKYPVRITLTVFAVVLVLVYFLTTSVKQPWEAGGRLVVAVRTTPGKTSNETIVLGIDTMRLVEQDGTNRTVNTLTKRVTLTPGSDHVDILFDMTAPVGDYSGLSFVLKSPELRNSWEEDTAPTPITLEGDTVQLDSAFRVEKETTSVIVLSFETIQALYDTDGATRYLPVIQVETRTGTTVTMNDDGSPVLEGGTIVKSATYGMGWDGLMHYNTRAKRLTNTVTTTEELPPTPGVETEEDTSTTVLTEVLTEETSSSIENTDEELLKEDLNEDEEEVKKENDDTAASSTEEI